MLRAAAELFGFVLETAEYPVGAAGVAEAGDSLPAADRGRRGPGGRGAARRRRAPVARRGRGTASPRGRAAGAPEAARGVRQPPAGHGSSRPAPRLTAPARAARRGGPPDRARAARRALLREPRALERDGRRQHHALLRGGDRAGGAGRVRGGSGPAEAGHLGGQGECAGGVAALAGDGDAGGGGLPRRRGSSTSTSITPRCASWPTRPRSTCC